MAVYIIIHSCVTAFFLHKKGINRKNKSYFFPENHKKLSDNTWSVRSADIVMIFCGFIVMNEVFFQDLCDSYFWHTAWLKLMSCTHWSINVLSAGVCFLMMTPFFIELFMNDEGLKTKIKCAGFCNKNVEVKKFYKKCYSVSPPE